MGAVDSTKGGTNAVRAEAAEKERVSRERDHPKESDEAKEESLKEKFQAALEKIGDGSSSEPQRKKSKLQEKMEYDG